MGKGAGIGAGRGRQGERRRQILAGFALGEIKTSETISNSLGELEMPF